MYKGFKAQDAFGKKLMRAEDGQHIQIFELVQLQGVSISSETAGSYNAALPQSSWLALGSDCSKGA